MPKKTKGSHRIMWFVSAQPQVGGTVFSIVEQLLRSAELAKITGCVCSSILSFDLFTASIPSIHAPCYASRPFPDYIEDGPLIQILKRKWALKKKAKVLMTRIVKKYFWHKYERHKLASIAKRHECNVFICLIWSGDDLERCSRFLSRKKRSRTIFLLLDPIAPSPRYNGAHKLALFQREKRVIQCSLAYFCPQGWKKAYSDLFPDSSVEEFFFPLLEFPPEKRQNSYSFMRDRPQLAIFGDLDNGKRDLSLLLKFLEIGNLQLTVYGKGPKSSRIIEKPRMSIRETPSFFSFYDFLIIQDNSGEDINYLPSKAILSIASRRPLICFGPGGNNTENYLSPHPYCFYAKNEGDFPALFRFIEEYSGKVIEEEILRSLFFENTIEAASKKILKKMGLLNDSAAIQ